MTSVAALRIGTEGHGLMNGNVGAAAPGTGSGAGTMNGCASIEEEYVTTRSQNRRTSKVSRCLGNSLCMPQNLLCFKVWPVIFLLHLFFLSIPLHHFAHLIVVMLWGRERERDKEERKTGK